jgi:hypothetical protein
MNRMPGSESFRTSLHEVEELLRKYAVLLELYSELESVSAVIFRALESGATARVIREQLEGKMQVAEKIVRESRLIAGLKKMVFEEGSCSEDDRIRVRQCEEHLTLAVNRIVEQENRGRDLVMRQGMRIERR